VRGSSQERRRDGELGGGRESRFLDEQAAVLELDVRELEAAIGGQPSATSREEAAEPSEA
jgi:hypothetical protein